MRSACLFWPVPKPRSPVFAPRITLASTTKPKPLDAVQQARIDNTVALLKLPPADRPHFITIYYSEPDHEGHEFGPDAPETKPP
jgi:hypothetical protein